MSQPEVVTLAMGVGDSRSAPRALATNLEFIAGGGPEIANGGGTWLIGGGLEFLNISNSAQHPWGWRLDLEFTRQAFSKANVDRLLILQSSGGLMYRINDNPESVLFWILGLDAFVGLSAAQDGPAGFVFGATFHLGGMLIGDGRVF